MIPNFLLTGATYQEHLTGGTYQEHFSSSRLLNHSGKAGHSQIPRLRSCVIVPQERRLHRRVKYLATIKAHEEKKTLLLRSYANDSGCCHMKNSNSGEEEDLLRLNSHFFTHASEGTTSLIFLPWLKSFSVLCATE